jgi:hypothetical protein
MTILRENLPLPSPKVLRLRSTGASIARLTTADFVFRNLANKGRFAVEGPSISNFSPPEAYNKLSGTFRFYRDSTWKPTTVPTSAIGKPFEGNLLDKRLAEVAQLRQITPELINDLQFEYNWTSHGEELSVKIQCKRHRFKGLEAEISLLRESQMFKTLQKVPRISLADPQQLESGLLVYPVDILPPLDVES